jgi:hypothetical protein
MDDERHERGGQIISGGVAALAVTLIVQLLQVPKLSWQLSIALLCFSVAVPLLTFCFTTYAVAKRPEVIRSRLLYVFVHLNCLVVIAGICLAVFHMDVRAGWVFVGSSVVAVLLSVVADSA